MQRYRCLNCGHLATEGEVCPRCDGVAHVDAAYAEPDPRQGWIKNYGLGLNYYALGFKFISKHRGLFRYVALPLAISFILFIGMVYGGFLLIDPLLGFLDSEWISWLEWLRVSLYWIAYVLFALLALLLSLFLTLILSTIINAPFYDLLSEKVEEIALGRKFDEKWSWEYVRRMIIVPIKESIKIALFELVVMAVLFVLSLLSAGLGTVLFAVAGAYFGALTIFDFILARKYYDLHEKRNYMKTNRGFVMGFGTPVYFVPFLTPFAVVGATLGFLASRQK